MRYSSSRGKTDRATRPPHPEERRRAARLEGWATPRLVPTLRDAVLRTAPQGEDVLIGPHYDVAVIAAEIFSADISVGKLVLAHGTTGKIEASTTRRPCTPLTRPWVSTTDIGSSGRPMRQVQEACHTPIAALRTKASSASSSFITCSKVKPSTTNLSMM